MLVRALSMQLISECANHVQSAVTVVALRELEGRITRVEVPAAHPVHALAPDEGPFPPLPVAHNVQLLDEEDENEPAKHDLQVEYVASSCAVAHGERERQGSVDSVTVRNQLGEWVDISTSGLKLTITAKGRPAEDAPPPATLQEGAQRAATLVLGLFDMFLFDDATSRPLHFARSQSRLE